MSPERQNPVSGLIDGVKKLGSLYIDDARLTAAEKLTTFLSAAAVALIALVMGLAMFIFIAIGLANLLESVIPPYLSYLLMAAFFALVVVVTVALRVKLIFDPISRFISRLLLTPPKEEQNGKEK